MAQAMPLGTGLSARLVALPPRRLQPGFCARPRAPGPGAVLVVVARRGGGSGGGQPVWLGKAAGRAASAAVADAPSARPLDSVVAASASAPPPPAPPSAAADGETLGDFAANLLQRRLRKAAKLQKRALRQVASTDGVGLDTVREVRVALRRLRNTLTGVEKALVLPAAGGAKQLTPALRALGASRDCEAIAACVLAAAAAAAEADGALPPAEAAVMASALRMVEARHAAGTAAAAAALRGRRVQRALSVLEAAVDGPLHVRKLAARPAAEGAARQLLHAVVNLLAHDAWDLDDLAPRDEAGDAAAKAGTLIRAPRRAPWEHALRVTSRRCETLHGLRKAIREVRYMMEAYAPLYAAEPAYSVQVASLAALQAHVGSMRDVEVSLESLPELVGCPALCAALQRTHAAAWAAFRAGREPLLAPRGRAALYQAILCVAGAGFGPAAGAQPHA